MSPCQMVFHLRLIAVRIDGSWLFRVRWMGSWIRIMSGRNCESL